MIEAHWLADLEARIVALAAGALLLLFGRRLFWLFVGVVGFFVGYSLSSGILPPEPEWLRFGLAAFLGVLGILLAVTVQKLGVALAGFLVGAWTAAGLLGIRLAAPLEAAPGSLLIAFLAGILAALLAVWLFGLALVVLSSLAGAGLIVEAVPLAGTARSLALVALAVVGIAIQTQMTSRGR